LSLRRCLAQLFVGGPGPLLGTSATSQPLQPPIFTISSEFIKAAAQDGRNQKEFSAATAAIYIPGPAGIGVCFITGGTQRSSRR